MIHNFCLVEWIPEIEQKTWMNRQIPFYFWQWLIWLQWCDGSLFSGRRLIILQLLMRFTRETQLHVSGILFDARAVVGFIYKTWALLSVHLMQTLRDLSKFSWVNLYIYACPCRQALTSSLESFRDSLQDWVVTCLIWWRLVNDIKSWKSTSYNACVWGTLNSKYLQLVLFETMGRKLDAWKKREYKPAPAAFSTIHRF